MLVRFIDESIKPDHLDLYGQSLLRQTNIKLKYLDEIATNIMKPEIDEENIQTKMEFLDVNLNAVIYSSIIDISEKLGFLFFSWNQITDFENHRDYFEDMPYQRMFSPLIKFHLYNFIYNAKAVLDSISVLLNDLYKLGFSGGDRDLARNTKFRSKVFNKNRTIKRLYEINEDRFNTLLKYRDAVIHRKSIMVFISIPKKIPFDYLLKRTEKMGSGLKHIIHMPTLISGKPKIKFKVKNGVLLTPHAFHYVMPKEPLNYEEITRKKFKKQKYIKIRRFCKNTFSVLRDFSEVVFEATYNSIKGSQR